MTKRDIPRILLSFLKYRVKELVGEEAWELSREALSDDLKNEKVNQVIGDLMADEVTRRQLIKAHEAADRCFRQRYAKQDDQDLVNILLAMALAGSPEIDDASEPYNRQTLKMAIADALKANLPKLSARKRATAAEHYLDCLESSLLTVDALTGQITGQLAREILKYTARIDRTTLRNSRDFNKFVQRFEELLQRFEAVKTQEAPFQPDPLPDPDIMPDRGRIPPGSTFIEPANHNFVGREADLKAIAQGLLYNPDGKVVSVTAATGMGGIGKTQLAAEFAHRYGRFYYGVHFLRLTEESTGLDPAIAACGYPDGMNLPNFPIEQDQQVALVEAAWAKSAPRLIIIDNLVDPELLRKWLNRLYGHHLLITSRASLPEDWGIINHPLDVLSAEESRDLLRKLAIHLKDSPNSELDKIGSRLGHLPLAIDLIGRYLSKRTLLPGEFITLLDQERNILNHTAFTTWAKNARIPSPTQHIQNLYATFELSWKLLAGQDAAKRLLIGCGYLAHNVPIPLELLTALFDNTPVSIPPSLLQRLENVPADKLESVKAMMLKMAGEDKAQTEAMFKAFEASMAGGDPAETRDMALVQLENVGLLNRKEDGLPTIHPLIAEFARLQVGEGDDVLAVLARKLARMAHDANISGIPANCAPLCTHVERLAQQAESAGNEDAGTLWNNLGYYLHLMLADHMGARAAYERALTIGEKLHGPDHPNIATRVNNLGLVLKGMGDLVGAKLYYENALRIDEQVYGPDHPNVAIRVNNLGSVLQDMGELPAAKVHLERALRIWEKMLGEDHPNVASAANNLGNVLRALGDLVGAKVHFERALRIDEQVYGPDHPNVAIRVNNLGSVLQDMGELPAAKVHLERALRIFEGVLGEDHPNIATSVNNLGLVLQVMGELPAAKAHYERALGIDEHIFGPDHPNVARDVNNLASVLQAMGDLAAAKPQYERALHIYEQTYGPDHPNVATSVNNLGSVLKDMGELAAAKVHLERALRIFEGVLGEDHPNVATLVNNLGALAYALGDLVGAKAYFERALRIFKAFLPAGHPNIGVVQGWLDDLNRELGGG